MSSLGRTRAILPPTEVATRQLLNSDPRIARAAIGKHVHEDHLDVERQSLIASGSWDLLGDGGMAVTRVRRREVDRTSARPVRVVGCGAMTLE
jgi:hypothetical protein